MAYGTLVTTFGLEVVQVQQQAAGLGPEARTSTGRSRRSSAPGQTIVSGLIWFAIVWLPVLAVLLVLVLVAPLGLPAVRAAVERRPGRAPIPGWGEGPGGS